MISGKCLILCAILLMTGIHPRITNAQSAGTEWMLLDENDESRYFYQRGTQQDKKTGTLRITTRVLYTPKGKAQALKILSAWDNLENLYESRYLHEIDCDRRESRLLAVTHLDRAGGRLRSTDLASVTEWESIGPDSRLDLASDQVCPH